MRSSAHEILRPSDRLSTANVSLVGAENPQLNVPDPVQEKKRILFNVKRVLGILY